LSLTVFRLSMTIPRSVRTGLLCILLLTLGWQLGSTYQSNKLLRTTELVNGVPLPGGSGSVVGDPEKEVNISLLWTVWRVLQQYYIEPGALNASTMVFGAAEGLVRSVGDPYTVFMTPKENTDFRKELSGTLEGIGAELQEKDELIVIVTPLKGSPAEKAGILPEDVIMEVNGETTQGMSLNQVVSKVRGPRGTTVNLKMFRPKTAKAIDLTITRAAITIPSVESKIIEDEAGPIGYVALNQFGDNSMDEFENALATFAGKDLKGVIVDLRFNGGGYLDGAVALTSMFLKQGTVVTVERRGAEPETHVAFGNPILPDVPMVVLINEGSASASEIVAGALQDHKRAKIIGMKSFGKGTVQEIVDIPGGSSLRVTVARWMLPNGRNLAKDGVHPDIVVDRTVEDAQAKKDPQLDAGVMWLTEGKEYVASSASSSSN
jgi:carboxyl-terminal processing protease